VASNDPLTDQESKEAAEEKPDATTPPPDHGTEWGLRVIAQQTINSAHEKPGDILQALVAEPVFDANHVLAISPGSVLVGPITQAKAPRSFGDRGKCGFVFGN
jgi:hypothetical protein